MLLPLCLPLMTLVADVVVGGRLPNEGSLTELSQSLTLVLCIGLYVVLARYQASLRALGLVFALLLSVALVREQDAYFAVLHPSAWVLFALPLLVLAVGIALANRAAFRAGFGQVARSPAFAVLFYGVLSVLFFSRVLGTKELWLIFLSFEGALVVKTIIQETLELTGYLLIFAASLEICFGLGCTNKAATLKEKQRPIETKHKRLTEF